jgi:Type II secretion system (T2SS), protein E, N-terminal domain
VRYGTSGDAPASHNSRMPLGLNLMSRGLLTAEQLKKATDEQKETGGEIGEVVVRQGFVSEKQVTEIRSAEWGCPVFKLPSHAAQIEIQVPSTLIRAYSMIPVHYVASTNLLYVGFVNSIEYGLLYAVEQLTGCKTTPCFVTPTAFQSEMEHTKQLQQGSAEPPVKELNFEGIRTPAEIARILCDTGLEMEAEEAFIGKCKEHVWARLKNGHKSADLLFKVG